MKKYFSILLFLFVFNFSLALSPLPKNAYLRAGDEQKEVLILQQILNSDPDTVITKTGAGSPGKETWFFGAYTTSALKKFQEKYGLEITGQIDFKTWSKINQYVASKNPVVKKVATSTAKTATTTEKNIYLDDNENPYISSDKTETKTTQNVPTKATNTTTEPTYLDSILAKYTGALTPISPTTQTISNTNPTSTYSPSAPYYNPQTGQYQSSPAQTSFGASSPYSTGASNLQPSYTQRPSTLDSLRTYLGQAQPQYPSGGQVGNGTFDGTKGTQSQRSGIIYEENSWVRGNKASNFGCNDATARQYFGTGENSNSNSTSMQAYSTNGKIPIDRDCKLFLIAVPLDVQKYYFGNLPLTKLYAIAAGTPFEVVNLNNNTCTVVPLWDTGPELTGAGSQFAIDLTNSVKLLLGGKGQNFPVRYRPVPKGEKGCTNYNFIDPNNKGLNIPQRK